MKTSSHSEAMFLQMLASAVGSAILSVAFVKTLNLPMESGILIIGALSYVLNDCFQKKLERLHAKELEAKDVSFVGIDDHHEYFARGLRMGRITHYSADEDINEDPLAMQINEAAKQSEKAELERQRLEMEAEAQKFIDEVETQIMLAHLNMVKAPGLVQKVPEYFTMKSLQGLNIVPTKRLIVLAMMRDQVIANNNFLQRSQDDNLESPL